MTALETLVFWSMATVFGVCIAIGVVLLFGYFIYWQERKRIKGR